MKEDTMPSKWSGGLHKGQVGTRWSPRGKNHRFDPEDKSYNAGEQEWSIQSHTWFSTEPTEEDGPSSVQRISIPIVSTWACWFVKNIGQRINGSADTWCGLHTIRTKEAWSDKLIMGEKRCGRKFSGSTSVRTQVKFAGLLASYLVRMRLACMPRLLRCGI